MRSGAPGPNTAIHNFSRQIPLFKKILDTPKSKCASTAIFNHGGYLQHKGALIPTKTPLNSTPHGFTQVWMIQGRMETSCWMSNSPSTGNQLSKEEEAELKRDHNLRVYEGFD